MGKEGKDLLPSLSNKGVLDKKEHRRRGRESLTNIFHLLLKHDDDEQGRGASLTSIKHHYKNTPFQYLERRRNSTSGNNWWLAKAAKKGNILLLSLGKIFAKFLRCHSHFFCFGKGTKKCIYYDYLILSSMIKVILDGAKRGLLFPTSNILPFSQAWKMYLSQRRHFSRINPQ